MSTGLTYVFIQDSTPSGPPAASGNFVFSSYEEAYNYGEWWSKLQQTLFGGGVYAYVTIYTTGPNSNGYWDANAVPPVFSPYD